MSQARLQPYGILCFAVPGIVFWSQSRMSCPTRLIHDALHSQLRACNSLHSLPV